MVSGPHSWDARRLAAEALLLIAIGAVLGYSVSKLGFRLVGSPVLEGARGRESYCHVHSIPGAIIVLPLRVSIWWS